jgi:hypothetical protein
LLFLGLLVVAWRWSERRVLDQRCAALASWVKATYPAPGAHPAILLPPQFRTLASDHLVDAIALGDGRVLLLLRTSLSWHHNWTGMIYSTGAIRPSEISPDASGRPQVMYPDLPEHFVSKQIDDTHFAAAFDLG